MNHDTRTGYQTIAEIEAALVKMREDERTARLTAEDADDLELALLRDLRDLTSTGGFVILTGNPGDGFTAYGPTDPEDVTESTFSSVTEWWALPLSPLPERV